MDIKDVPRLVEKASIACPKAFEVQNSSTGPSRETSVHPVNYKTSWEPCSHLTANGSPPRSSIPTSDL